MKIWHRIIIKIKARKTVTIITVASKSPYIIKKTIFASYKAIKLELKTKILL